MGCGCGRAFCPAAASVRLRAAFSLTYVCNFVNRLRPSRREAPGFGPGQPALCCSWPRGWPPLDSCSGGVPVLPPPLLSRADQGEQCAPTPALAGPGRGGSWGLCRAGCLWPCVLWDLTWGRVVRWRAQSYLLRRLPSFRGYPSRAAPFPRRRCGPVALGGAPALLALKGAQRNLRCHATQPVGIWWPGFVTDGHRRSAGAGLPAPRGRAQTRGKAEKGRWTQSAGDTA